MTAKRKTARRRHVRANPIRTPAELFGYALLAVQAITVQSGDGYQYPTGLTHAERRKVLVLALDISEAGQK